MSQLIHDLGGRITLVEFEYAHRYRDYLELGDEKPDASGFDPERIAEIERILNERHAANLGRIRDSRG